MNLWWCHLLYFIGYSQWTLTFPWVWTLYLSIFYYHYKHNYHRIFTLEAIDRFCYLLVKTLMFTVFNHHTNPETDDCASLLIKVYYSTLILLSNNINASPAATGIFLTCNNTMRPIALQLLTLLRFTQTVHSQPWRTKNNHYSFFQYFKKMLLTQPQILKAIDDFQYLHLRLMKLRQYKLEMITWNAE